MLPELPQRGNYMTRLAKFQTRRTPMRTLHFVLATVAVVHRLSESDSILDSLMMTTRLRHLGFRQHLDIEMSQTMRVGHKKSLEKLRSVLAALPVQVEVVVAGNMLLVNNRCQSALHYIRQCRIKG
jgi:hypothetical protein